MMVSITNAQVPNALMRRLIQAGMSAGGLRSAPTVMNVAMNSATRGKQDRVVDELAPVPLHRLEADAHFGSDCVGGDSAVGRRAQHQRHGEAERHDHGERRPQHAMECAVPARHADLALIQRKSTYGHSAAAPGRIRMRAPRLTGAGCTRVTPNSDERDRRHGADRRVEGERVEQECDDGVH